MNKKTKQFLFSLVGITSLIFTITSPLFVPTKKANAFLAACIGISAPAVGTATGAGAALIPISVPTADVVNLPLNTLQAQSQADQWIKDCLLDGLLTFIAKAIIKQFTVSIVTWAQSGFNGSPTFIQNPEQFFLGVADLVAGSVIEEIAPFLCSPFKLQILLSLKLGYNSSTRKNTSCTLSNVVGNVEDFANGKFFETNGWDGWNRMTQGPQNNPYGAYIQAQEEIAIRIATAQGTEKISLDWGKGFRPIMDELNNILTPGALIESQLSETLGTDLRQLELADEINEIVGAVVGGLLTQIISGGFAGSSPSSSISQGSSNEPGIRVDQASKLIGTEQGPKDNLSILDNLPNVQKTSSTSTATTTSSTNTNPTTTLNNRVNITFYNLPDYEKTLFSVPKLNGFSEPIILIENDPKTGRIEKEIWMKYYSDRNDSRRYNEWAFQLSANQSMSTIVENVLYKIVYKYVNPNGSVLDTKTIFVDIIEPSGVFEVKEI